MSQEERTLRELEQSVGEAQKVLLEIVYRNPEKWWDARDLRLEARNGLSGEVLMFALTDLVNQQKVRLDQRLRVRAL